MPNKQENAFGSLFQVESNSDEIFISGATVEDVEIIPSISQGNLKATGTVVTSAVESATTVTATSGGSAGTETTTASTTTTTTTPTTTTTSTSSGY